MDKETAKAINNLHKTLNETIKRVDNLYSELHKENAENIDANASGIDEMADVVAGQQVALDDLAEAVDELLG